MGIISRLAVLLTDPEERKQVELFLSTGLFICRLHLWGIDKGECVFGCAVGDAVPVNGVVIFPRE